MKQFENALPMERRHSVWETFVTWSFTITEIYSKVGSKKPGDLGADLAKPVEPAEVKKRLTWLKVTAVRGDSDTERPETKARSRTGAPLKGP